MLLFAETTNDTSVSNAGWRRIRRPPRARPPPAVARREADAARPPRSRARRRSTWPRPPRAPPRGRRAPRRRAPRARAVRARAGRRRARPPRPPRAATETPVRRRASRPGRSPRARAAARAPRCAILPAASIGTHAAAPPLPPDTGRRAVSRAAARPVRRGPPRPPVAPDVGPVPNLGLRSHAATDPGRPRRRLLRALPRRIPDRRDARGRVLRARDEALGGSGTTPAPGRCTRRRRRSSRSTEGGCPARPRPSVRCPASAPPRPPPSRRSRS